MKTFFNSIKNPSFFLLATSRLLSTGTITTSSFAAAVNYTCANGLLGIGASDFDGDAKMDLVVAGQLTGGAYVFRNTSSSGTITASSFALPVTFTVAGTSYGLVVGELTGDGKPEIIVPTISSFSVSVLQNNSTPGTISFSPKIDFVSNGGNRAGAVGDLDGDGRNDLMVGTNSSSVAVFRNLMGMNANVLTTSVSCNGGSNGQLIVTAYSQNTLGILWSNAATTFSLNNLAAGAYTYAVTSGTCLLTQSVAVQQPAPVNVTAISASTLICEGQSAVLTASGAATFSWSTGAGTASVSVSPSLTTSYVVTGTLNGCVNTATVIQAVSVFSLSAQASQSVICEGEIITLTAAGASNYTWSGVGTGPFVTATPVSTTIYTLNATNADGCAKSATVNVDVNSCVGINTVKEDRLVKLYPSPNTGRFAVLVTDQLIGSELEIYDVTGKLVLRKTIEQDKTEINLQSDVSGIYFIKVGKTEKYLTFIKQ